MRIGLALAAGLIVIGVAVPAIGSRRQLCSFCPPECESYAEGYELYRYVDEYPSFRDDCGYLHFHDGSYTAYRYECPEGHVEVIVERSPPCLCGWPATTWTDPCKKP